MFKTIRSWIKAIAMFIACLFGLIMFIFFYPTIKRGWDKLIDDLINFNL